MVRDQQYWIQKRNELLENLRTSPRYRYWSGRALMSISKLPKGEAYTGEGIRVEIRLTAGDPVHHNHWGALIQEAARQGLIVRTGRYEHMQLPQSHGRESPQWRIV